MIRRSGRGVNAEKLTCNAICVERAQGATHCNDVARVYLGAARASGRARITIKVRLVCPSRA
jgi:hypothetical protein